MMRSEKAKQHRLEYNRNFAKKYRLEHPLEIRAHERQRRLKAKIDALTHYGNGKCACVQCGESRLACLSIDHINGNGAQARRENHAKVGSNFYKWLRHKGYPDGYQTLCMNCQYVKRYINNELGGARGQSR